MPGTTLGFVSISVNKRASFLSSPKWYAEWLYAYMLKGADIINNGNIKWDKQHKQALPCSLGTHSLGKCSTRRSGKVSWGKYFLSWDQIAKYTQDGEEWPGKVFWKLATMCAKAWKQRDMTFQGEIIQGRIVYNKENDGQVLLIISEDGISMGTLWVNLSSV